MLFQEPVGHGLRQPVPGADQGLVQVGRAHARVARRGLPEVAAQHEQHGAQAVQLLGRAAQGVQALGLGGLGQLVQVVVQLLHKVGELRLGARLGPAHVGDHALLLRRGQQIQRHALAHRALVLRLPLVQQVMHLGQGLVQAAGGERRGLVADDGGAPAALGLGGLADVVGDVGVGHGNVAQRQQRRVVHRQAALLARQPFLRAMRAVVHQRVVVPARPQIGGQVVVRRQVGGGVVDLLFLGARVLAARRHAAAAGLGQQRDVAELKARNHEVVHAVLAQHPGGFLGRAPGARQRLLRGARQAGEPGAVVLDGQQRGQAVAQERLKLAAAVGRGQQALQQGDQMRLVGRHLGSVARGRHRGQRGLQAARHVEERGREVLLARGVVPEHHGHALVGVGLALQLDQVQRLGGHGRGLGRDGHDLLVALARGRRHLNVGDARVLGLGQVEGHVHGGNALLARGPLGLVATAVGHGLDDGDAHALELGAALVGVERDLGVDEQVGQHGRAGPAGLQYLGEPPLAHHGRVERQGHGAAGLHARDHVVDVGRLHRAYVLLVQRNGDDGLVPRGRPVYTLSAQIGMHVARHQAGPARVVDAGLGEDHGVGRRGQRVAALELRRQRGEEALVVLAPAARVIGDEAARHGLGQAPAPGRACVVQPGIGRGQAGQRAHQAVAHLVLQIAVEEHRITPAPQAGIDVGRQAVQVAHLDLDAMGARNLGQLVELALRHIARGDEQHRRGTRHADQQEQRGAQQPAHEFHSQIGLLRPMGARQQLLFL